MLTETEIKSFQYAQVYVRIKFTMSVFVVIAKIKVRRLLLLTFPKIDYCLKYLLHCIVIHIAVLVLLSHLRTTLVIYNCLLIIV